MTRLAITLLLLLHAALLEAKKPMPTIQTAIFAGGCFWCMQPPYENEPGVTEVLAGYTGGKGLKPNYHDYIDKGHTEAVQVKFDPAKVTYARLLEIFWQSINPTDPDGQFADRGPGYYAGIYYLDATQKAEAEKSKAALAKSGRFDKPIVTPILPASFFTAAEEHHQGYARKNQLHYMLYKKGSGRAGFLEEVWKDQQKGKK